MSSRKDGDVKENAAAPAAGSGIAAAAADAKVHETAAAIAEKVAKLIDPFAQQVAAACRAGTLFRFELRVDERRFGMAFAPPSPADDKGSVLSDAQVNAYAVSVLTRFAATSAVTILQNGGKDAILSVHFKSG